MKVAVRVQDSNPRKNTMTVIVDISNEINEEDRIHDACHDAVEELGFSPKWIRVEGDVKIEPINY